MSNSSSLIVTYNYCRICGHVPQSEADEPNYVRRFWEPDDGWVIGALCHWCYDEFGKVLPSPDDYAYESTNRVCDQEETDEDPSPLLDILYGFEIRGDVR